MVRRRLAPVWLGRIAILFLGCGVAGCARAPLATARAEPSSDHAVGPCPLEWAAPFDLRLPDGRRVYVESPHPIATRRGVALLGSPTFVWERPDAFFDSAGRNRTVASQGQYVGALIDDAGRVSMIARPDVRGHIGEILVAERDSATIDVLWATPPPAKPEDEHSYSQIWHATFDGATWSKPELVVEADNIAWSRMTAAAFSSDGVLHVAVRAFDNTHAAASHTGAIYARHDARGWMTRWLEPGGTGPQFVTFASIARDDLSLVFAGALRSGDAEPRV